MGGVYIITEEGLPSASSARAIKIMRALRDIGPMTTASLAIELNVDIDCLAQTVFGLRKRTKAFSRRIYIKGWVYTQDGSDLKYPRALYALGNRADAPKPPRITNAEHKKKVRTSKTAMVCSVFELGMDVTKAEPVRTARMALTKTTTASNIVTPKVPKGPRAKKPPTAVKDE